MDQVIDPFGVVRRLGSKPLLNRNKVSNIPLLSSASSDFDDATIRQILQDSARQTRREIFGKKWKLNQHELGSCNGFAGAGGLGKTRFLRGVQDELLFSGAYIYSKINGGRDEGSNLEDGWRIIEKVGVAPASLVPYNQIYPRLQPANADAEAAKYKGLNLFRLQTLQNLRTALCKGFMCIVAVHVGNQFMRVSRGISGIDAGIGNHAILIQDLKWDSNRWLYDHDGSWGLQYGDEGNSWLTDNHFTTTIRYHQFYAIVSSVES